MSVARLICLRLPELWALLLALLLLGPAMLPGYVLTYDMVWVPQLDLRPDFLGVGSGLPRAVPSDAVVAVLDQVVPGMLLQKLVLLGSLTFGGVGASRLVGSLPLAPRLAAVTVYVWSPFVVERLVIGHWPLLLAYATLPWLLCSLGAWRRGSGDRRWWLLVVLGSLSASAGLLTAAAVLIAGVSRHAGTRRWLEIGSVLLAANAPWWVTGLLHVDATTSDVRAFEVFGLSAEGLLPAPLAALGLGGIWNADVVPASRTGFLGVAALVVLLGLSAVAVRHCRAAWRAAGGSRLTFLWVVGMTGAVVTWAAPGILGTVNATVPGVAVMRDGARFLMLCAPAVAVLVAHGTAALLSWWPSHPRPPATGWQHKVVAVALVVWPVALMSDAAWGMSGRLQAVQFPESLEQARAAVDQRGDVLILPFSSYRAPDWNGGRAVFDPTGRFLRPDYLTNDALVIDGVPLPGEDPRARQAEAALSGPEPSAALAELGIRTVVIDRTAPEEVPRLEGQRLLDGDLEVIRINGAQEQSAPTGWWMAATVAWVGFLALVGAGAAQSLRPWWSRIRPWRGHR